jgi:hypothetical protein
MKYPQTKKEKKERKKVSLKKGTEINPILQIQ